MSLRVLFGLTLVLGATRAPGARAGGAVAVEIDGPAPFARAELEHALRVRVGAAGRTGAVRVRVVATDGGVIVEAHGGSQRVALGGRAGADAARLVALVAADLMLADLAEAPDPAEAPGPAARPPGLVEAHAAVAREPARAPIAVAVLGSAARWAGVLADATVDVAVPRGRWIGSVELGGGGLIGGGIDLRGAVVRVGGGVRAGLVEVRAGITVAPVEVRDGTGDCTVLAGAGASARLRVPIAPTVRIVLAAGADAFATRTEYRKDGMALTATPWLAPWLGAGLEVAR